MKITDQSRIIKNPENPEETRVPVMPLLVLLGNGIIGEAKSLRGATAIVIGTEYYDAEDNEDEWHYRVEHSRIEAMRALAAGLNIKITDTNLGEIKNNYAAAEDDPDYEDDTEENPSMSISVENEKTFLLSLAEIGAIRIMEREDSSVFNKEITDSCNCGKCTLKKQNVEGNIICNVYAAVRNETESCMSGTVGSVKEYVGGEYIVI